MGTSFAHQKGPLLVDVIKERNCRAVIGAMRNGTLDGAMGFDVHLATLAESELTVEKLRTVFGATDLPTLALHYPHGGPIVPDEKRAELFCRSIEAGASCVDMQGCTFQEGDTIRTLEGSGRPFAAARPKEVTLDGEVIARQCAFVDRIHAMGGEVLLSTHTGTFMDCAQTTALIEFLLERKPDVIKLVGNADTDEELAEYFKTLLTLVNAGYPAKIHYHCNGKRGTITRVVGPMLGSYLMFCVDRFGELSTLSQLPLKQMTDMYAMLARL